MAISIPFIAISSCLKGYFFAVRDIFIPITSQFSEQFIKLTVNKKRTVITGEGLKITVFNKSTGELVAEGDFFDIKFEGEKTPLIKRLFK